LFELSIALRYLLPRRRQLSVSIIALLSILVISLVVWLILVFFSVTHGMERRWMDSFVTFHSPLQLTPTDRYFHSYYHEIDRYAADSGYRTLSIGEKLRRDGGDPYDPDFDGELPAGFPPPDEVDPVQDADQAIRGLGGRFRGLAVRDYEVSLTGLNLTQMRPLHGRLEERQRLSQLSYVASFDGTNHRLSKKIDAPTPLDLSHLLQLAGEKEAERFFAHARVTALEVGERGWKLPAIEAPLEAIGLMLGERLTQAIVPLDVGDLGELEAALQERGWHTRRGTLVGRLFDGVETESYLAHGTQVKARHLGGLRFQLQDSIQGNLLEEETEYDGWSIGEAHAVVEFDKEPQIEPLWVYRFDGEMRLPTHTPWGDGVLVASGFRKNGSRLGDGGHLSYYANGQEQQLPVYIAGFYDPGFMPVGAKLVLAPAWITAVVRSSMEQFAAREGNGLQVWIDDVAKVDDLKSAVQKALERAGVADYWQVESFKEYEQSRALVEQFQSDRTLFSLISLIIIAVACSNIISMLILLVNDKRREIGILLAMGASRKSVAAIFGVCGIVLGAASCLLGIVAAILTLHHLDLVIGALSAIQGHQAFNPIFFGDSLPSELSLRALSFALGATVVISLIAGLIPAIKASRIRPSTILRSG